MHTKTLLLAFALFLPAAATAQSFTVTSSNMWRSGSEGFDYTTGRMPVGPAVNLPGMAGFYRRSMPLGYGIIGLQEVDVGSNRALLLNVPQLIDNAMGGGWRNRFGPNRAVPGGFMGNAVVTNVRITKTQTWRFPYSRYLKHYYGNEQRGAIGTKLDFGVGKQLWFVTTHLEPDDSIALRQALDLMNKLRGLDILTPMILVGDFNIRNTDPTSYNQLQAILGLSGFRDVSRNLPTALAKPPSILLAGQLDYIFVRDPLNRLTVTNCVSRYVYSGRYIHSDHLALIASFRWRY